MDFYYTNLRLQITYIVISSLQETVNIEMKSRTFKNITVLS